MREICIACITCTAKHREASPQPNVGTRGGDYVEASVLVRPRSALVAGAKVTAIGQTKGVVGRTFLQSNQSASQALQHTQRAKSEKVVVSLFSHAWESRGVRAHTSQ